MSRSVSPDEARERARDILDDSRFGAAPTPPGFIRRILDTIGDGVNRAFDAVYRFLAWVAPGSGIVSVIVWIALVCAAVLFIVAVLRRARVRRGGSNGATSGRSAAAEPAALDHAADDAESAGRFDEAVRLRFAAGLARLEQRHAVRVGTKRTNHQVAAQLSTRADAASAQRLAALGDRLDGIVHGSAVATRDDAVDARVRWAELHDSLTGGTDRGRTPSDVR